MKKRHKLLFIILLVILLLFLIKIKKLSVDEYAPNFMALGLAGVDKENYTNQLNELLLKENMSDFAKADIYLILGRLNFDKNLICKSVDIYDKISTPNSEEKALIYETIASIGCGKNKKEYYQKAADLWKELGNSFRANLDKSLAENKQLEFVYIPFALDESNKEKIEKWNKITIGSSEFRLNNSDILVSQTDRVTRDWLSYQFQPIYSQNLLTVFSERLYLNQTELLPEIGWHEGARIKELKQIGLNHKIASGTIVIKINDKWYAPDEKGVFRFEILPDKVFYPTTRFLKPDIAVIIDTHGISALVEQAIRYNATVVVGCCDYPDKIKAAKYLSDRGIKIICFTDRFLPDILFQDKNILGSPPIKQENGSFVLGNQPIVIKKQDTVIAMDVSPESNNNTILYYDTPARYFKQLQKIININVIYIPITDFNQMNKIIESAENLNTNIIAVRVFNSDDYSKVKEWLEKSKEHKAVLFHSTAYPYGYKLFKEFPEQTSFDDINPIIE